MRLVSFNVKNFRSINDSGPIDVSQITAILGATRAASRTCCVLCTASTRQRGSRL
jgi:hypothetical protein